MQASRINPNVALLVGVLVPGAGHILLGLVGQGLFYLFACMLAGMWFILGGDLTGAILYVLLYAGSIATAYHEGKHASA